jgi:hypothetical protein
MQTVKTKGYAMSEALEALVDSLRGREKGRTRASQIIAVLTAKDEKGLVFGNEGARVADVISEAMAIADGMPRKVRKKKTSSPNHAVAASVLKHIETAYETAFHTAFECNYGYSTPQLSRLIDGGESAEVLCQLADLWVSAGRGELVPNDTFQNRRIWGDAKVTSFISNLNLIKSYYRPAPKPQTQWVMAGGSQ